MKTGSRLVAALFYFVAFSMSAFALAYETDPTQEMNFYCPEYKNCTGNQCRYNRMNPISGEKTFNKSEKAAVGCDSLDLEFNFPNGTDESFIGNESWTCTRYYGPTGHHFAILQISLDKPSGVNGSQVECKANIGKCTLFNETSTQTTYVAGLPDDCILWTEYLKERKDPYKTDAFYCPVYTNCTGGTCRYNRAAPVHMEKSFNKSEKAAMQCGDTDVEFNFPNSTDDSFVGNESWDCFQYMDSDGQHFAIATIFLDKPSGVNGSQVECKASIGECTFFNETSSQMVYIAGLPADCVPWTDDLIDEETTTPATGNGFRQDFGIVVAMTAALFIRQYL